MRISRLIKREIPFFIVAPALLWQVLFFYVPLLCIFVLSFLDFSDTGAVKYLTGYHYIHFLSVPFLFIIFKSLCLAFTTSFICLIVGYPLAYFISFKARRWKTIFLFLLILPFWTNFLLHIYAWFFVLERSGFLNTVLLRLGIIQEPLLLLNSLPAILLLMVYSYLPFMVLPIYSILEKFDLRLLEASADLGATRWQTLMQVVLPLSFQGITSGFILVLVPAFGEFAIPALMGGEKYVFVGSVISQYILANKTMARGAAFTMVSLAFLLFFMIVAYSGIRKFLKKEKA